jgi:hypothetical protein
LKDLVKNEIYKVEFGTIMFNVRIWIIRSQLKLYLFPDQSIYSSECFPRLGPIKVKGEEVWILKKIETNSKKDKHYVLLVCWEGHPECKVIWEPLAHLAGSEELVEGYWYKGHDVDVLFNFLILAKKPMSHFVAQLPTMSLLDSEVDPAEFWKDLQNLEYKSQKEFKCPMDMCWS